MFNGDTVVTFADFTVFLGLGLALFWNIYKLRRQSWVGDKLRNVILQQTVLVSRTTTMQSTLRDKVRLPTLFGGRAAEYSGTGQGVYGGIFLKILPNLSTMSSSPTSLPGILDVSSSPVYWYPRVWRAINDCTLLLMKLKATCSALIPTSLKALIFCSSSGS
jgi:hypothetical protein